MGVLRYKILRDLWANKGRTLQVVLIIGIGAAALGMILTTRNLVIPGMEQIWSSMHPAMINLFVGPPLTEEELLALKQTEGVVEIEGTSQTTVEWRLDPQSEWRQGGLTARAEYEDQQLNRLELTGGQWPQDEVLAVGQDSEAFYGIPREAAVFLRVNEREFRLETGGVVYDQLAQPATFGGTAQFYASPELYERLIGDSNYSQVLVRAAEYDEQKVTALADELQAKLDKQGKSSGRLITDPAKHFFQDQMDGLFLLLGVLGGFALILGLLLVYNTVNALISQQVDQIGVMKAIGARTWQILRLFFFNVLAYGLLALAFALPAGVLGGWAITSWLVGSFGADIGSFQVSTPAIVIMALICLFAPIAASFLPILMAARVTVQEAINTYGLKSEAGLIERLVSRIRFLSRLALLTISNTFRHKGRVVLMQITLVLSGLIFMMVISVRDSVVYTIRDVLFSILDANITMVFERSYRIERVESLTLAYPGVKDVEMWGLLGATIRPADQPESEDDESVTLFGVPLPTQLYGYQLREGRWLDETDGYAVVLNMQLAEDVGVSTGDWITVQYDEDNARDWQVVGLVFDPILTTSANVPRDVMLRDTGQVGRAITVWIQTEQEGLEAESALATELREYYKQNGIAVSPQRGVFGGIGGDSSTETALALIAQFNFLIVLLAIMAVVIGMVGSIALSGAISLSVMERIREIGVMRAIGASSWAISRLFVGEGLILGWLSWLIALPLSLPGGQVMVKALGAAFQLDLVYRYTPQGAIYWLLIVTILSIGASWLPARGATRITVRESLAYQ